jgi:uncharacterized membrane protein
MITLTVWRFDTPSGAEQALPGLARLVAAGQASVDDAALVAWPHGRRKPSTRVVGCLDGPGSLWGGFWGVLLALIFITPLAGPSFGAAAGAFAGCLADFGVGDDMVLRVREDVVPGTSALFVISDRESAERLGVELQGLAAVGARTELSPAQEQHLREALGDEADQLDRV